MSKGPQGVNTAMLKSMSEHNSHGAGGSNISSGEFGMGSYVGVDGKLMHGIGQTNLDQFTMGKGIEIPFLGTGESVLDKNPFNDIFDGSLRPFDINVAVSYASGIQYYGDLRFQALAPGEQLNAMPGPAGLGGPQKRGGASY